MDVGRPVTAPPAFEVAMLGLTLFDSATAGIRRWVVELLVQAIAQAGHPEDRHAAILWLIRSRDVLGGHGSPAERLEALGGLMEPRSAVAALAGQVAAAVMAYRTADVPWSLKLAIPTTLFGDPASGWPLPGLPQAGLAAFGPAAGMPAPLLAFLGTAGITAVIEGVAAHPQSATGIALVAARILRAEASRQAERWFAAEMVRDPVAPRAAAMPRQEDALRAALLAMPPADFGRHVMSFFEAAGLEAVATPGGAERGLDGYARHAAGLVIVQCRQGGLENKLGSPALERFRSVMSDARAWRGYLVTTSCFTAGAVSGASKGKGPVLVDMDGLVRWHRDGLAVAA